MSRNGKQFDVVGNNPRSLLHGIKSSGASLCLRYIYRLMKFGAEDLNAAERSSTAHKPSALWQP